MKSTVGLVAVFLIIITQFSQFGESQSHKKNANLLDDIHTTVLEIYEHIKKQDKFQDIKDLLQIDAALKKIEQHNDEISRHLSGSMGRSGVSNNGVQQIEQKLDTIEEQMRSNVQGSIRKMGDVEKQTSEMKSDMDKKLGKMMNVMSSVYEMSQKVTDKLEIGKGAKQTQNDDSSNYIIEQFDDLEQKITEKFNHIEHQFDKELKIIEATVNDIYRSCDDLTANVETIKNQCEQPTLTQNSGALPDENALQRMTDRIVQNLTRTQRNINEKMEKKLLDLEAHILQQNQRHQPGHQPKTLRHSEQQTIHAKQNPEKDPLITSETVQIQTGVKACRSITDLKTPTCCWQLYKAGATCDGPYVIFPQGKKAIFTQCDMTHNGGGWTVIMRRGNYGSKSTTFDRNWNDYKEGFGDNTGEFWLGNENIHLLSNQEEMILEVSLESFDGEKTSFEFDPFAIASESQNYRLHVGRVHGNKSYFGSSLRQHNMRPFSTFDKNNEGGKDNSASKYKGGWWYNRGHYALLTAPLFKETDPRQKWEGIQWHAWKGQNPLKSAEMKIRPKNPK